MLEIENLTVGYGERTVVDDVSFSVRPGQWLMIVGPNGAGKSTVINAVSQNTCFTGTVRLSGTDIRKIRQQDFARRVGVLTQNHYVGYPFTVEEIVRMGRYAYAPGIFSKESGDDEELVERALELTGMEPLRKQSVLTLSGGELQRTFLAQIFAQNPKLLILDEPTNHLDLIYQQQVFDLIRDWIHEGPRAVMSVVHDLSLARAYGTDALLLDRGRIASYGAIDDVLSAENLKSVYGMDVYAWMQKMLSQWEEAEEALPLRLKQA
ncbi:MAG TPA: ABC transporter ATP-binding protein [Oscillospiraceae bacterium]|nr:ABC transporter ATP-binding protein [Oscillospiraceae bacterium]HRW57825.1 ABC transporter ATP-binding protein [Oscillospiraceae bacterium]